MKRNKSLRVFILVAVMLSLVASTSACKSTKRKGCGCGADLNRMYKPRR